MMVKRSIELRWHARAGQGAVTAAKMLAETVLRKGRYGQAFPEYGPERAGAPLKAYNRISHTPIRTHAQVLKPNVVIICDPTLLRSADVLAGIGDTTVFVVNSPHPPEKVVLELGLGPHTVHALDATRIAFVETGRRFPNMAMLGALVRATGIVGINALLLQVFEDLRGRTSFEALKANLRAMRRGYREVRSAVGAGAGRSLAPSAGPVLFGWKEMLPGSAIAEAGSASAYATGGWRTVRPELNQRCNNCLLCWFFCPDSAVLINEAKVVGFDLEHCKGCGICAEICPPRIKAIDLVPEHAAEERAS